MVESCAFDAIRGAQVLSSELEVLEPAELKHLVAPLHRRVFIIVVPCCMVSMPTCGSLSFSIGNTGDSSSQSITHQVCARVTASTFVG